MLNSRQFYIIVSFPATYHWKANSHGGESYFTEQRGPPLSTFFFFFHRRTGPAHTGVGLILDLGTDGDGFAVPTRVPTVRQGTRCTCAGTGYL
jgi:hypothetical protein